VVAAAAVVDSVAVAAVVAAGTNHSSPVLDPADPFPFPGDWTYAQEQQHSEAVDSWLGLRTDLIESGLLKRGPDFFCAQAQDTPTEYWVGLPTRALLTPYSELRALLAHLAPHPGDTVVDLGAGYGRLGFVLGRHYPGTGFVGYECVKERVDETRRCLDPLAYPGVRMELADLSDPAFSPAPAKFYFVYDFGARSAIEKALQDLRLIARDRAIVVVGRGRSCRDAIERQHPWLSQVVAPEHFTRFSIYRSA
jgi:hypothetical protein